MKTFGETGNVWFNPFHDGRYESNRRLGRGMSIRVRMEDVNRPHEWRVPKRLYNPFNMRVQVDFQGNRTYTFLDPVGIIRIDTTFSNENHYYGPLKGIGKTQPIQRVVEDKDHNGRIVFSLNSSLVTEGDLKEQWVSLPTFHLDHDKASREDFDVGISQFGILSDIFTQPDNELALNTALRCGLSNPKIYLRGHEFNRDMVVFVGRDTLVTIKFKDGTYINTTVDRLKNVLYRDIPLSGLIGINEEWLMLFRNSTDHHFVNLDHPAYPEIEWIASINLNHSVAVDVWHKLTDRNDIINLFKPATREDIFITIDENFIVENGNGLATLNSMVAEKLKKDTRNVIYVNGKIQAVESGWDGNTDEPYTMFTEYCGTIADLDDKTYERIMGKAKPPGIGAALIEEFY